VRLPLELLVERGEALVLLHPRLAAVGDLPLDAQHVALLPDLQGADRELDPDLLAGAVAHPVFGQEPTLAPDAQGRLLHLGRLLREEQPLQLLALQLGRLVAEQPGAGRVHSHVAPLPGEEEEAVPRVVEAGLEQLQLGVELFLAPVALRDVQEQAGEAEPSRLLADLDLVGDPEQVTFGVEHPVDQAEAEVPVPEVVGDRVEDALPLVEIQVFLEEILIGHPGLGRDAEQPDGLFADVGEAQAGGDRFPGYRGQGIEEAVGVADLVPELLQLLLEVEQLVGDGRLTGWLVPW